MSAFVAIDFETANRRPNCACAIGLAAGQASRIVAVRSFLIRPPTPQFEFSAIHGIRWSDVCDTPTFAGLWPTVLDWIDSKEFVAAHNARFDRRVLEESCATYRISPPRIPSICTVELARAKWGIYPTTLPDVCRQLGISLHHHEPGSDAEACARIVLAAEAEGWECPSSLRSQLCSRSAGPTPGDSSTFTARAVAAARRTPICSSAADGSMPSAAVSAAT